MKNLKTAAGRGTGTQGGLTLIEMLVTVIISAIFFAALVPVIVYAQRQSSGDRARVIAANVAQAKLETVRSVDWADLDEDGAYFTSDEGVAAGFGATWPNDEGGPVKNYEIAYDVDFVSSPNDPDEVVYKLVTVDVSWTPPPSPVKHVILKTAVYPQYRGPEIVDMTVGPTTGTGEDEYLFQLPVEVKAQVNPVDVSETAYVRFIVGAANGSFAEYEDVTTPDADGWFTWSWQGAGAGDGEYQFTAVAVSTNDRLGASWKRSYMLDIGPPAPPTLTEAGVQAGNGVISLQWSPPNPVAGDLDHYVVERSDGVTTVTIDSLTKASTTYVDRGLTNGTSYSYTVYAVDQRDRVSSPSATVARTPAVQDDQVAPSPPATLTATLVGQNVTLTWAANTASDGVVVYRIYRGPEDTARTSPIAVIPVETGRTSYSYIDPQIGWNVAHTYYVTAVDAALNESGEAVSVPVQTPAAPPEQAFGLTVKVTGQDAIVMVASLVNGYVYDINGDRIVDDRSVSPILVKANQKWGVTFSNLPYSTYRVTVTPVDAQRNPTADPRSQDVELVRNETITFTL